MKAWPLMEHFYTLQGEGWHQGRAAYFIRLAGCDIGCSWCDVKESWNAENYPEVQIENLIEFVSNTKAPIVVITGGEPAMYPLETLCDAMHAIQKKVHIETSGAYPILGDFDWITLSPKRFKKAITDSLQRANELKVVIAHENDLRWADTFRKDISESCLLYLQPEWDAREKMMPLIVQKVMEEPEWRISLQTHKYLNIP